MKANEFRISDFVASLRYNSIVQDEEGKLFRVAGVDTFNCKVMTSADDTWYSGDIFYPIPLTEEWLLKLGFEKIRTFDELTMFFIGENPVTKDWMLELKWLDGYASPFYRNGHHKIEYVHQLQNLYFALTGEELTTK